MSRHTPPAGWRQAFEAELLPLMERTGVPGVGVTLFDGREVLLEAGYGLRNVRAGLPVTGDTIFGIASITKSFTAASLQLLASDGLLSSDDPVSDHLPFTLWQGGEPARLRHFLDHTSGLAPTPTMTWLRVASQLEDPVAGAASRAEALSTVEGGEAELVRLAAQVGTFDGLVQWLNQNGVLLGAPGEVFSYSNDAFCLMGGVVERVAGLPLDEFVRRRLLEPLGMRRTTFDLGRVLADDNSTSLYEGSGSQVEPSPAWQTTGRMQGGGMLKSTLADLRTWVRFLMAPEEYVATGGALAPHAPLGPGAVSVDPARVHAMAEGGVRAGPTGTYCLGLRRDEADGLTLIGHSGGLKGVSSYLAWVPELGVGVVVLSNLANLPSQKMATMAVNAYAGRALDVGVFAPAEFAGAPAEADALLADLLGNYASGEPYGRFRLFADEEGQLRAAVGEPAEVVPAYLVGPDEVALRFAEHVAPALFLRRQDGTVWAAQQGSRVLLRR